MTFDQPKRFRIWPSFAWVPYGSVRSVMNASASVTFIAPPGASSPDSILISPRANGSIWPNRLNSTSRGKNRFSRPVKVPPFAFCTLCCVKLPTKSPAMPMSNRSWPEPLTWTHELRRRRWAHLRLWIRRRLRQRTGRHRRRRHLGLRLGLQALQPLRQALELLAELLDLPAHRGGVLCRRRRRSHRDEQRAYDDSQ